MTVILLRAITFYIFLTLTMKFMGKRQIGEMQLSELVTTVLLSELAVLPVTDENIPFLHGFLPLCVISCMEITVSYLCKRFKRLDDFINGNAVTLYENGKFCGKNLDKTRITKEDVIAQVRINGYSDISLVEKVILERTGKMSVLPKNSEPRSNQSGG